MPALRALLLTDIQEVPDGYFEEDDVAYAYIAGVGKAFTGINTARTIESEDFDGIALQGAGKAGEYILPDNKKAVAKVTLTTMGGVTPPADAAAVVGTGVVGTATVG